MAVEPWPLGTDAGGEVRKRLISYITMWLKDPKYHARLAKQHWHVLDQGETVSSGVKIRVVAEADPKPPWTYSAGNRSAVTDTHRIGVFVKADKAAGGAASVSSFHGALRALFASREGAPERNALEAAGLGECMESSEEFVGDPDENKATVFRQSIQLVCITDTYLN